MTMAPLPDLDALTTMDERQRQVPKDNAGYRRALAAGERELQAARAGNDPLRLRRALTWVGTAQRIGGAYEAAEATLQEALDLARDAGDASQALGAMIRLAELYSCRDEYLRAEMLLRLALKVMDRDGPDTYRDVALQHLGKTLTDAGRAAEAIPLLEQALTLRRQRAAAAPVAATEAALARAHAMSADRA